MDKAFKKRFDQEMFHALSNALQLLPETYRRLKPGKQIARAIEKEFEIHGLEKSD